MNVPEAFKLCFSSADLDGLKLAIITHSICRRHRFGGTLLWYASVPPPFKSFPISVHEPLYCCDYLTVFFMPLRPRSSLALLQPTRRKRECK